MIHGKEWSFAIHHLLLKRFNGLLYRRKVFRENVNRESLALVSRNYTYHFVIGVCYRIKHDLHLIWVFELIFLLKTPYTNSIKMD